MVKWETISTVHRLDNCLFSACFAFVTGSACTGTLYVSALAINNDKDDGQAGEQVGWLAQLSSFVNLLHGTQLFQRRRSIESAVAVMSAC